MKKPLMTHHTSTYTFARRRQVTLYEMIELEVPASLSEAEVRQEIETYIESEELKAGLPFSQRFNDWRRWLAPSVPGEVVKEGLTLLHEGEPSALSEEAWRDPNLPDEIRSTALLNTQLLDPWRGAAVYLDTARSSEHFFDTGYHADVHRVNQVFNRLNVIQADEVDEADIFIYRQTPSSFHRALNALGRGKLIISREALYLFVKDLYDMMVREELTEASDHEGLHDERLMRVVDKRDHITSPPPINVHVDRQEVRMDRNWLTLCHVNLLGEPTLTRSYTKLIAERLNSAPELSKVDFDEEGPDRFVRLSMDERGQLSGGHLTCVYQKCAFTIAPHAASLERSHVLMICLTAPLSEGSAQEQRPRTAQRHTETLRELKAQLHEVRYLLREREQPVVVLMPSDELTVESSYPSELTGLFNVNASHQLSSELHKRLIRGELAHELHQLVYQAGGRFLGAFQVERDEGAAASFVWRLTQSLSKAHKTYQRFSTFKALDPERFTYENSKGNGANLVDFYEGVVSGFRLPLTLRQLPAVTHKLSHLAQRGAQGAAQAPWLSAHSFQIAAVPVTRGFVYELKRAYGEFWPTHFKAPWLREPLQRMTPYPCAADQAPEGRFSHFIDVLLFINLLNHHLDRAEPYELYRVEETFGYEERSKRFTKGRNVKGYRLRLSQREETLIEDTHNLTLLGGGYAYRRSAHYESSYRLPTREEWLRAAHLAHVGGLSTVEELAPFIHERSFKPRGKAPDTRSPSPVASARPNPFGLYDLFGGVREWVEETVANKAVTMGGSYLTSPKAALKLRALTPQAPHPSLPPEAWPHDLGVRLVMGLAPRPAYLQLTPPPAPPPVFPQK